MSERNASGNAVLQVSGLNVYYGASHALQGVDLALQSGVLSVVGRNGMGKTTLCKAIMGLVPVSSGSIRFRGEEIANRTPAQVARLGIGYVPQGRRLWRSLSVDEHLRMVGGKGAWTADRIYATFPRLAERKNNGGAQLSGGEQQMLAIARALLLNPQLLIMDEPTEGLAPVIVNQVEEMLIHLAQEGEMDVLVIEQNIGVATAVAEQVAIMVNGQVNRLVDAASLANDRALQQRLLGVGRHGDDGDEAVPESAGEAASGELDARSGGGVPGAARIVYLSNPRIPTRWSKRVSPQLIERSARTRTEAGESAMASVVPMQATPPVAGRPVVIIAGTFDTKGRELYFIRDVLKARDIPVQTVDLSTSSHHSGADVPAHQVAAFHPRGSSGVFTSDRGTAMAGMTLAFERWLGALNGLQGGSRGSATGSVQGSAQSAVLGMIGAGGSGGTALVAPAMRSLPFGVPKVLISTVASGDVRRYVGPADILMLHSVADVQGLNSITREVLANGAHALAGMVEGRKSTSSGASSPVGRKPGPGPGSVPGSGSAFGQAAGLARPAVGITMFGVTTPCVQQLSAALEERYDCLVFHATGIGGESMESLIDKGEIRAVIDITTTEVCDLHMGGVFACTEDRFGAVVRTRIPYVGACGALDMVNFAAPESVPERFRGRTLYEHNPQITLMRTTVEENRAMGQWIGERLNRMDGPVRFFLPEGGVSALAVPGMPFHEPAADRALFDSLTATVRQTGQRQLVRSTHHVNAPEFVAEVLTAFQELHGGSVRSNRQRQTS